MEMEDDDLVESHNHGEPFLQYIPGSTPPKDHSWRRGEPDK